MGHNGDIAIEAQKFFSVYCIVASSFCNEFIVLVPFTIIDYDNMYTFFFLNDKHCIYIIYTY